MSLPEQYQAALALSPRAANVARRLLGGTPGLSEEWQYTLRLALMQRARHARRMTPLDWYAVLRVRHRRAATRFALVTNEDHLAAWRFLDGLRDECELGHSMAW